ncbi:unnamed protein product [Trichogramma brassicae]|uniref:Uncharacterized protein n=1 Tax=Trichogramma brassicae TaxID=86971 RepID=A0A6H5IWN4_9HYME|nr:unnamed protein product [Trichogramma brassicae]
MQVGNNSNASTNGMDSRKMDELDMDADTPNYIEESEEENDEIKELIFELAGQFAIDLNDNDEECLVVNDEIALQDDI